MASVRSRRLVAAIAVVVVALAVLALAGLKLFKPEPDAASRMPEVPAELVRLLDGLKPGDTIAGCQVLALHAAQDQQPARVELQRGQAIFSVGIGPKGSSPKRPPIVLEQHEVTYGWQRGTERASDTVMLRAAQVVAERVSRGR